MKITMGFLAKRLWCIEWDSRFVNWTWKRMIEMTVEVWRR